MEEGFTAGECILVAKEKKTNNSLEKNITKTITQKS